MRIFPHMTPPRPQLRAYPQIFSVELQYEYQKYRNYQRVNNYRLDEHEAEHHGGPYVACCFGLTGNAVHCLCPDKDDESIRYS